ncbi:MAG: response regulator transcription factor, partial [Mollicutes bacterium]|nr:response regulator transcription factor [Mollicutes bacterium]
DQKIADIKDYQKSNIYENIGKEHKNIIIVNQDKDIEEILKNKVKERKITYSYLLDGNDLIDRIKSKREYDYIIIGDELKGINGISILRELQKLEDFKTPIIIIVDKNKENLAKHYLEQGFDNYILYSNFEEDLNKVLDTY